MNRYYIPIESKEHNLQVQKYVLALGYRWSSSVHFNRWTTHVVKEATGLLLCSNTITWSDRPFESWEQQYFFHDDNIKMWDLGWLKGTRTL